MVSELQTTRGGSRNIVNLVCMMGHDQSRFVDYPLTIRRRVCAPVQGAAEEA